MEIPTFEGETIITDTFIPPIDQWQGFVNNKHLVGELIHYITQRLLENQLDPNQTFHPPPGTFLFVFVIHYSNFFILGKVLSVHGGRTFKPNRYVFPMLLPEPTVYYVETALEEQKRLGGITNLVPVRRQGQHQQYSSKEVEYLLEAEIATLYFARHHPTENCLFVSPDGDLLLLLLLMAPDRIDPNTGNFRNCHYLRLTLDGNDDFVDINALYSAIISDSKLAAYKNPVLAFVALSTLLKNDYIHSFCPGVKTCHPEGVLAPFFTETNVPIVYQVMYDKSVKYAQLFNIEPLIRMNDNIPCLPHINEALWIEFIHDCYLTKYQTSTSRKFKIPPSTVSILNVKMLLSTYKNRDSDIMSLERMRVFERQLLWLLEYWHNSYRGSCMTYPPHALYRNKSYYGWMINASGGCLPAEEVSEERPHETKSINKMFSVAWDDLEDEENKKRSREKNDDKDEEEPETKKARRFEVGTVIRNNTKQYKIRKHIPEVPVTSIMSQFSSQSQLDDD